jgi:hypothetical protein
VIAVVLLAAAFVIPRFLTPTVPPDTLRALEEAELARRQLRSYNASMPLVGAFSDLERLKEADFGRLVERSQDAFATLGEQFAKRVRAAQLSDRQNNLPQTDLRAVGGSPSGVQSAVGRFEGALRDNRALLDTAANSARSATQTDRDALGVGHVAGMVKLAKASRLLADARRLRAQLATRQADAVAVAAEWAAVRSEKDHYAGLNVANIQGNLSADLGKISEALAESERRVDALRRAIAEREQALATTRAALEQARAERLSLKEMGFTVGDDASFADYRERYLELSQRLGALQQRQQLLAVGGIRGGQPADDDFLEGELRGGETVIGLEELRRRLAIAEANLERYQQARRALNDQQSLVKTFGDDAQTQENRYTERLEALTAKANRVSEDLAAVNQQAFEKENTAIQAAREAASAFKLAQSAVQGWKRAAEELQREKDPQRMNERLSRIARDTLAGEFVSSAEAQAKTLLGRIHTERALGLAGYLSTLRRMTELMPGSAFEAEPLEEAFNTAREEAISTLGEARELYGRLAQKGGPSSWIHQSSLAAVFHLLWQIDEFNAAQHRSEVINQLGKAVGGRERFPYLQQQVALQQAVGGSAPAPGPEADVEEEPLEEAPAEPQPADEAEPGEPQPEPNSP